MRRTSLAVGLALLTTSTATACMWDYDTLRQERARFPGTLELITGKFLRHSKEFYQWRIEDRLRRLQGEPKNAALYDDLAVAYEKTGQNAKAIETMLKVEEFQPGRYETYSNLATFYFLGGQFDKALSTVNKALEINPDAHFGREKYQKYLTEYVISKLKDGKLVLPLRHANRDEGQNNFYSYLKYETQDLGERGVQKEDVQKAIKGVLGMMRFAYYDSPVLLEVLGDLLHMDGPHVSIDAKQLAARAYLQASYRSPAGMTKKGYFGIAREALSLQVESGTDEKEISIDKVEAVFRKELDDATNWSRELHNREIGWIRDGVDPEAAFDALSAEEPTVIGDIAETDAYPGAPRSYFGQSKAFFVVAAVALALAVLFLLRYRLAGKKPPSAT